jgi:hypothetical protein
LGWTEPKGDAWALRGLTTAPDTAQEKDFNLPCINLAKKKKTCMHDHWRLRLRACTSGKAHHRAQPNCRYIIIMRATLCVVLAQDRNEEEVPKASLA